MRPEGDEPSDWKEMTRGGWGRSVLTSLTSSGVSLVPTSLTPSATLPHGLVRFSTLTFPIPFATSGGGLRPTT